MIRCAECGARLRFEEIADHMDEKHPPHEHRKERDRARLDSTTRIGQAMVTATRKEENR